MNKSPKGFAQSALRPAEESRAIDTHCGRQPDKHDRLDRYRGLLAIADQTSPGVRDRYR